MSHLFNPLKLERERQRVRKGSRRIEAKRKFWGEARDVFISGGREHFVVSYPGHAC
jgi:hypothetical protein